MLSKLKTLLVAGAALPLAAGFAFAQNALPTTAPVANPPAATRDLGALKATPAEKKAQHEKTTAATPATKTAALAPKHHVVKKHQAMQKTDAKSSGVGTTNSPAKASDAVPAKKL